MNRKTTSKGQQEANPEMTMLVYREMSYPAREVQGKDGNYLVSPGAVVVYRKAGRCIIKMHKASGSLSQVPTNMAL